jgi:hypothetical protein
MNPYCWHNHGFGDASGNGYGIQQPSCAGFMPPPAPTGFGWFDLAQSFNQPFNQPFSGFMPSGNLPFPFGQYSGIPNAGKFNDGGFPGIAYKNAHGGYGLEPGYNYIFPQEHCKIHVLISDKPPWQNDGQYQKRCFEVPCGLTIKGLMQGFGCNNPDPKKNKLYELSQGGDGRWYVGFQVHGGEDKKMKMAIEEVGWNKKRNGVDQDFVWLYFTKD